MIIAVTPLDVIKTRLQAQQSALLSNKCFLYCNGLMDHICPCGPTTPAPTATKAKPAISSSHFKGTIVSGNEMHLDYIVPNSYSLFPSCCRMHL